MKMEVQLRVTEAAEYIMKTGATVRACAESFGVSKTTIHKDDGVIIGTVKGNAKKH